MEFDYVIVGGGTAGCIIGRRLAEDGASRVAIIEAGAAFEHDDLVLGYHGGVPLLGNPTYDYCYGIVEQPRGNSGILMSRAKMLGGCSAHNDTVAFLPPARDMDEWESLGAVGWGSAATRPYFDRAIDRTHVHPAPDDHELAVAVNRAAAQMGVPERDLHGTGFDEAAGWLYLNERDGVRQSTAVAYLFPLADLPDNLTVITEAWASKILFDGTRAVGVKTSIGDVTALREVIVCAGAIDSPRLLMLSGIGPAERLRAVGLEVVVDVPAVGENLVDHLELPVMWRTRREVGPSLQAAYSAVLSKTKPDVDGFDMFSQVILDAYSRELPLDGEAGEPLHAFCFVPCIAKPRSRGSVALDPEDPSRPLLIDPAYLSDPDGVDERILFGGVRFARRLAEQEALQEWIDVELAPGPGVASDDEDALRDYIRRASNTVYHPAGTCRMGSVDDRDVVVDPHLLVRGTSGLRVADASVFPSMISVNLCLTVMMIGERCAALIRDSTTAG
jgi:choline oxidase